MKTLPDDDDLFERYVEAEIREFARVRGITNPTPEQWADMRVGVRSAIAKALSAVEPGETCH